MMLNAESFRPAPYLRNGHLQTILASSPFRAWGKNPMYEAAREMIITTSGGVRLLGFYSSQKIKKSKGLVILLHGWEGSVASTYILRTGNLLYGRGYDIFRLNFRDHGDSHHLNQGIFYAVLLEEVFQAVHQLCRYAEQNPVFLTGFSLGGNFALRIARKMLQTPIANLCHVAAISPVLNPAKSTFRIDQYPIIPVADFYQLELNHHTRLVIHAFGGHNAFIDGFFLKSWYEKKLADMFDKIVLNNAIGKIPAASL
jgi:predicted alpha/beta-fold hydrolase